eukprot:TRINITY_DN33184_c0_g2_i1.p1 TRINITY_DN33184_c0_g2~~TRINITY_DN33184_c0_g2_i1.p1  ORF type:complete len:109 (+),score=8.62 TRINITY_DN33184_c0_g2_i1:40-366(+)
MKTQRNPIYSPSFHTTTRSYKTLSHFKTKTHIIYWRNHQLAIQELQPRKEKKTVSSTSFHSPRFPYTNPLVKFKPESLSLNSTRESTNESYSIIKQFLPYSSSPLEIQ